MPDSLDAYLNPAPRTPRRGSKLSSDQISSTLRQAGWDERHIPTMAAIAQAESSGNPLAHNPKYPDDSYGLLQVNRLAHPEFSPDELRDPVGNAKAALKVFRDKKQGFKAWSTYSSGAYKRHLNQGLQRPTSGLDAYLDPPSEQTPPPSGINTDTATSPTSAPSAPNITDALDALTASTNQATERIKRQSARQRPRSPLMERFGQQRSLDLERREQEQAALAEAKADLQSERGGYGAPTGRGILRILSSPVSKFSELAKSDEQIIQERAAEKLKAQQIARDPEVTEQRQRYGQMSSPRRIVERPLQKAGASILQLGGGLTSALGIAPNQLSEWMTRRGQLIESAASLPPLAEERSLTSLITGDQTLQEVDVGAAEKITTGITDLGLGLGQILLLKRASKLSFPNLLALEAAAKNSDKSASEQAARAAEGYALGVGLETLTSRGANAAISGIPTGAQTGYEVAQGRMSPLDAAIQTGIQTGAGALLTNPSPSRRRIANRLVEIAEAESQTTPPRIGFRERFQQQQEAAPEGIRSRVPTTDEVPLPKRDPVIERYLDEPQVQPQPDVQAQREAVERQPTTATPEEIVRLERTDSQEAAAPMSEDVSATQAAQRFYHRDYGEVTESPNQRRVGKGRVRVVGEDGSQHVIKRADMSGRGNQRAIPIREPEQGSVPDQKPDVEARKPLNLVPIAEKPQQITPDQSKVVESPGIQENITDSITAPVMAKTPDTLVPEQVLQVNREILSSPEFREQVLTESVGGNAGEGRAAVNAAVDNQGRVVRLGNRQDFPAEIQAKLDSGEYSHVSFMVKDALTDEPVVERVVVHARQQGQPAEIKSQWYADFEDPARSTGDVPPEFQKIASTTSARKSQLAADRAALDLPELPAAERKSWHKSLSEAKPEQAGRLADEVLNRPRALSDSETASIVVRAQQVKNEHAAKLKEISSAKPDDLPRLQSELETLEREFDTLTQATKLSGTEKGRALAAQKLTINQDFDLVSMLARFKASAGREPRPDERAKIEDLSRRNAELEQKLAQAEDKLSQQRVQGEIDRVARRQRRTQTKVQIEVEWADLKNQFAEIRQREAGFFKSEEGSFDPEAVRLIGRMVRNRVQAGVTNAEDLVDELHGIVGGDRRELRDAVSGYSIGPKTTRSELQKQIDTLKAELQTLSRTEDVEAGVRSPRREGPKQSEATRLPMEGPRKSEAARSGQPLHGPRPSDARKLPAAGPKITDAPFVGPRPSDIRRVPQPGPKLSDVNRLKAEGPQMVAHGPSKAPFSRDLARQRAIQRQIEDLEAQMSSGQYREKAEREPPRYTRETHRLQKELQQVRNEYERMKQRATMGRWGYALHTLSGLRKSWMLSGLSTQAKNIGGTGGYQVFDEVSRLPAVIADAAIAPFTGQRSISGPSPVAMLDSALHAVRTGGREAVEILRTGATKEQLERHQFSEIDTGIKLVDYTSNLVFRFMSASDRVFYQHAYRRNLTDRAQIQAKNEGKGQERSRELIENPPEELDAAAKHDALVATFNNDNALSDAIKRARGRLGPEANFAIDMVMPFDRTPTNVVARIVEASPVGAARAVHRLARSAVNKSLTQEEQRQFSQAMGRATVGTALIGLGWALADSLLEVDEYKVMMNVGGYRIDLAAVSPVGNLVALGARLRENYDKGSTAGAVEALGTVPLQQPMLKGAEDVSRVLKEPKETAVKSGARLASSFIPFGGLARDVAKFSDPEEGRYARSDSFRQQVTQGVPGLRQRLPITERPKTRAERWAREVVRERMKGLQTDGDGPETDQYVTLRTRSRRGEDVTAEIEQLRSTLTDRQIRGIVAARNKTRLQEDVNRLGIRDALLVYSVASPQQRDELKAMIEKKSALVNTLKPEDQEVVRQRLSQFGFSVPQMRLSRPSRASRESRVER